MILFPGLIPYQSQIPIQSPTNIFYFLLFNFFADAFNFPLSKIDKNKRNKNGEENRKWKNRQKEDS